MRKNTYTALLSAHDVALMMFLSQLLFCRASVKLSLADMLTRGKNHG
jgi:hypothetical protein